MAYVPLTTRAATCFTAGKVRAFGLGPPPGKRAQTQGPEIGSGFRGEQRCLCPPLENTLAKSITYYQLRAGCICVCLGAHTSQAPH